jgi:hypothetical protein
VISWSAYAPRRARDPIAWLAAKRIVTPEGLREELLALGIDPQTFPQDIAEAYLGPLGSTTESEPSVCMAPAPEVESAPVDTAQAAAKRPTKRFGRVIPT